MHQSTGLVLLQHLAKLDLLEVKGSAFYVAVHPQPVHMLDVKEAFVAIADAYGNVKDLTFIETRGLVVHVKGRFFEKLFKVIYLNERILPREREGRMDRGFREIPLPSLFIGSEKTQVRQIPLVETKPWPFKFLLELGGMIVVRTRDTKGLLVELRQFLNNHPQFSIRVDAKEWPDGSIAIFTWWFERVPKKLIKKNVNVPPRN